MNPPQGLPFTARKKNNSASVLKKQLGFTLIEVLITITILSVLSLLISQSIQQAIRYKIKAQREIDEISRLRDALRLMERDVQLAYHYRDLEKEMEALVTKKPTAKPDPTNPNFTPQFPNAREAPRMDPVTHFIGQEDSLHFVTSNNSRTVRNSKQADFIEVGYSLKDCQSLGEGGGSSKCLWRRSSSIVDDDVTKGGEAVVLLENLKEFKLRYIGKGKQDWNKDWRTDDGGDGATKNNFPDAVEISITIDGKKIKGKNKTYQSQLVVPIHFPNNKNNDDQEGGSNASASAAGATQDPPADPEDKKNPGR
ncbi:MAG: type II secretion system protein GspJ [Pseudobdellovibrionaceae bacterium]